MMVLITLIGEPQAKVGNRFYYLGPLTECKDCKLKNVCFNMEPGHLYEVISIRNAEHDCEIHESKVRAVEVSMVSMSAAVHSKKAIDGSMITFEAINCNRPGCVNYGYCHPPGIKAGAKISISNIVRDLDCPIGEKLALVSIT